MCGLSSNFDNETQIKPAEPFFAEIQLMQGRHDKEPGNIAKIDYFFNRFMKMYEFLGN